MKKLVLLFLTLGCLNNSLFCIDIWRDSEIEYSKKQNKKEIIKAVAIVGGILVIGIGGPLMLVTCRKTTVGKTLFKTFAPEEYKSIREAEKKLQKVERECTEELRILQEQLDTQKRSLRELKQQKAEQEKREFEKHREKLREFEERKRTRIEEEEKVAQLNKKQQEAYQRRQKEQEEQKKQYRQHIEEIQKKQEELRIQLKEVEAAGQKEANDIIVQGASDFAAIQAKAQQEFQKIKKKSQIKLCQQALNDEELD